MSGWHMPTAAKPQYCDGCGLEMQSIGTFVGTTDGKRYHYGCQPKEPMSRARIKTGVEIAKAYHYRRAAADELYEALNELRNYADLSEEHRDLAEAALAKARGEAA